MRDYKHLHNSPGTNLSDELKTDREQLNKLYDENYK